MYGASVYDVIYMNFFIYKDWSSCARVRADIYISPSTPSTPTPFDPRPSTPQLTKCTIKHIFAEKFHYSGQIS